MREKIEMKKMGAQREKTEGEKEKRRKVEKGMNI